MAAPTTTTVEPPSILMADRLYARAFALTVRAHGTRPATDELLELAGGDAHLIGAARERCAVLAAEHPDSAHADRALALVTHAWLVAMAARPSTER